MTGFSGKALPNNKQIPIRATLLFDALLGDENNGSTATSIINAVLTMSTIGLVKEYSRRRLAIDRRTIS